MAVYIAVLLSVLPGTSSYCSCAIVNDSIFVFVFYFQMSMLKHTNNVLLEWPKETNKPHTPALLFAHLRSTFAVTPISHGNILIPLYLHVLVLETVVPAIIDSAQRVSKRCYSFEKILNWSCKVTYGLVAKYQEKTPNNIAHFSLQIWLI